LATLADASSDLEFADACWKRGLELDPSESVNVWKAASQYRTAESVVEDVLPPRVETLISIAEKVEDTPTRQLLVEKGPPWRAARRP
jgi:hypothetical protein